MFIVQIYIIKLVFLILINNGKVLRVHCTCQNLRELETEENWKV